MALSARDKRIITDIERNLTVEDMVWAWRFAHRLRRFERLERRAPHPARQCAKFAAFIMGWLVALGLAAAYGWPWLCVEFAVAAAILVLPPALNRRRQRGPRADV